MFIKELKLQEGIFSSSDTFEKTTLIYSQKNTKGKSTYLRLMFYSLGYQIPSMKGVEYSNIYTELVLNERGEDFYINRAVNTISVKTKDSDEIIYSLPYEHNAFLAYIFDNNKIKVLNNIIGIMYVDQEKGWSLLNRGTVIGRNKFNIEELIAGLAGIDCDELLEKKRILKDNEKKYQAMLDINKLSEEVYENNGEIFINDVESKINSAMSLVDLKIRDVKSKIKVIEDSIKSESGFWKFIDTIRLSVEHNDELIRVSKDNVIYSQDSLEYLKARKNLLETDLRKLLKDKAQLKNKLEEYYRKNTDLLKLFGDSQETIINRKLSTFSFDQDIVDNLLGKVRSDLKTVNKTIQTTLKTNNKYIQKIYDYVCKYAKILQIEENIKANKEYIFTTELKSFSGANLQKLVFAFKVAFLKVIEEVLGTKLIMVLDSPRGKELDDENLKLIMKVVEDDLKENQVFIASIYDDFYYDKKIELKGKAIENRE